MLRAEEFQSDTTKINGIEVNVTSYRIGHRYYCHIANTDAGATFARAEGSTREEALHHAMVTASGRLTKRESK